MKSSPSRKKIKRYLVSMIFVLSVFTGSIYSQDHKLEMSVYNFQGKRAYLASLRGDESTIIDSTSVLGGELQFIFDAGYPPGMYRIFFDPPSREGMFDREPKYVEVIYDRENIKMLTSYNAPFQDMVVIESDENQMYFRFLNLKSDYRNRLGLLLSLFDYYSPEDSFFPPLHKELLELQKSYNDSILLWANKDPDMLSSSIISLYREPVYDPLLQPNLNEFMRNNFLKPVSFDDPGLLNTPILTNKILTYLSFFRVQTDQEAQELAFIDAVDNIMAEVSYNEELYNFVLNYLIDGFERFQMERVLVHIADNHLTGECKTENEEIVKERLEAYKRMAPGNKVTDINLLDPFDQPYRLSDLRNERILLIFWSSECPHCTNMLPRLNKWYQEEKGALDLEIFTVSIDKSRADWEEFVLINELKGINVYDPDGWESKTSRQYNLYATPTMFLLDKERKILAKPLTFKEFLRELD